MNRIFYRNSRVKNLNFINRRKRERVSTYFFYATIDCDYCIWRKNKFK